jgi:ParB-like chromosome segregation protein Spo0J
MDAEMFAKERASIREFGFVDPLTVRGLHDRYQVIDGEHRLRGGIEEGFDELPCVVVDVDDDTAKQLTIVLNETRGTANVAKMGELVKGLAEKFDRVTLQQVMPFSAERVAEMLGERKAVDFSGLAKPYAKPNREHYVERVFRLPRESAATVDGAIERAMKEHGLEQSWEGLEVIATEYTE